MFKALVLPFLLVASARRVATVSQKQSSNWGTVITAAFSAGDVFTAAATGVGALGTLVVGLKLAPRWAGKMVKLLTRFV